MKRPLALLALLAACTASSDFEPKSGTWYYTGSTLEPGTNTCGTDEPPTDPAGDFELTVNADGSLTVDTAEFDSDDFDGVFTCTRDGDSYSCPQRAAGSNKPSALDATLFYEASIRGTFESETELSGTQTIKLRCEGASCQLGADALMVTLPCSYSYSFTAVAR